VSGSCISLPYWDWEIDSGKEGQSYVLQSSTFGSVDNISKKGKHKGCVTGGIADYRDFWKTTAWKGTCLKRELAFDENEPNEEDQTFADESNMMQRILGRTIEKFDLMEATPHGNVHIFVG
jgi:hypothetical protein